MKITDRAQIQTWLPSKLIPRKISQSLLASLKEPEITILYGPRQVGKSIEATLCMQYLLEMGEQDVFYFNLDFSEENFDNPERFINLIDSQRQSLQKKVFVFFDEAQKLDNIGSFVKYIYDRHLNIKFFLTGSSSLEIKQKVKETLTGRKIEFLLMPLGLDEILEYQGIDVNKLHGSFNQTDQILNDYLLYGGYPSIVTTVGGEDKVRKLKEIAESYVIKDVFNLFKISSETELRTVAIYLAQNVGGILSKEGLGQLAGISKYEIEKIILALEKSFIIFLVRPFSKNPATEMVHRPKVYYYDLGIRNALLRRLETQLLVSDRGQIFENSIAIQLKNSKGLDNLKYWRTKNQTEVDFVTINSLGNLNAWEAKFVSNANTTSGLQALETKYHNLVKGVALITKNNFWEVL